MNRHIQVAPFSWPGGHYRVLLGKQIMRWGFQVLPDAIIIRLFGVLDQTLGEMFERATARAANLNKRQVVIDFSDIESFDEVGLMFCGYGLHHFRQLGIPFALVKPPASLLPVLQKHGLPEIPPVFLETQSVPDPN